MTQTINTVCIDAILVPLLRERGLPETLLLAKLSPRMQKMGSQWDRLLETGRDVTPDIRSVG